MGAREVHLERLLSKRVLDVHGRSAGRIEEVRGVRHGSVLEVREYLLGPAALLTRVIRTTLRLPVLRLAARGPLAPSPHRVPWEAMDLSDPEHPRLRCAREALRPGGEGARGEARGGG